MHFTFIVRKSVHYVEFIVVYSECIDIFITFADMKNIVYLSLAFLLLNACSYKNNSYPQFLLQADSLASVNPDSAVSLLKSIKEEMVFQPEEVRMYYQSLCVKVVWALIDTATVRKSLYNYTLQENVSNQLKVENARKQLHLTESVLGIVFIISCFFIFYMYNKNKRLKLEVQLMKLKHIEEEQYQKSPYFVEENKKEQEEFQKKLQAADCDKTSLKEKLLKMKEKLYHTGQAAKLEIKIREHKREQLLDTDIYKYFEALCRNDGLLQIPSEKWIMLEEAINEAYQGFTGTLFRIHKLSEHELQVCLLIKVGISPKGIAKLTNHSKESVTSTRRRMYKKFFGCKGTPQRWDEFINSL